MFAFLLWEETELKTGDEEETEEKGTFDSYYFINGQSHVAVAVEDD